MSFTCPDCGRTSHHPMDEREQYCGNCHEFKGDKVSDHDIAFMEELLRLDSENRVRRDDDRTE